MIKMNDGWMQARFYMMHHAFRFRSGLESPVMSRARQLEGVDAHVHQASRRNDQVVDRATFDWTDLCIAMP